MRSRKVLSKVFLGPGKSEEKSRSFQGEILHGLSPSILATQGREQDRRKVLRHPGAAQRRVPLGTEHIPGTSMGNDSTLMYGFVGGR